MRFGGLRLRYGRTRTTGLAAAAMHPNSMSALNEFVATGTQLKIERPGKAAAISMCDSINGPIIRLKDGSVVDYTDTAKKVNHDVVDKILFVGDILFNYGDFSENGHKLVPVGYCEEWWIKEFEKAAINLFGSLNFEKIANILKVKPEHIHLIFNKPITTKLSSRLSIFISEQFKIPLHPKFTYFWKGITKEEFLEFYELIKIAKIKKEDNKIKKIIIQATRQKKEVFEKIGLPHMYVNNEIVVIEEDHANTIYYIFSNNKVDKQTKLNDTALEIVNESTNIEINDKAGTFIGARMGRPEKAKMRKLLGSPHFLFPVGNEGGRLRSIQTALEVGKINSEFPIFFCNNCKKETIFLICDNCDNKTQPAFYNKITKVITNKEDENTIPHRKKDININQIFKNTLKKFNIGIFPDLIKGVRGTSNKTHITEHILKGVLRAKHGIFVNKDGTTRYDMIEMPITHFKPIEIGTPLEKLIELGYSEDINGKKLTTDTQIIELFPQDQILPAAMEIDDEPSDEVLFRVSKFIDELLIKLYKTKAHYNLNTKKDLVGCLVVGLAPHTSAGTVGRIIGFSKTQSMYSHPMFHAAMRRNCDGDEACVMLLMDAFLNFSRAYLPDRRGSRTMDAPLVLTSLLVPGEVDDEVHGMDIAWSYPLELYESASQYKNPWDIDIVQIDNVLNTPKQYSGMGYTHTVSDINKGIMCSAYKTLPTMQDKLTSQMDLAKKLAAVDETGVAELVIEKHFLKDIKGNLRKFSTQKFRCVKCNTKYRRPPLAGKCNTCNGKIIFTISEGSIIKYLQPTISLAKTFKVRPYLMQTIEILNNQIDSILGKESEIQEGLGKWFG